MKENQLKSSSLNKQGEDLYNKEKWLEAVDKFEKTVELEPSSAWFNQNLAETKARLGKWEEAVRLYRKALILDPKMVETHQKKQFKKISYNRNLLDSSKINNPVFIVGCGHSGTSIMLALLGNHPEIYPIPKESALFLKTDKVVEKIMSEWDNKVIELGKSHWIEKTPPHIFQISRFLALRPNSKFILMLRDGRDVVCSLKHRVGYSNVKDRIERWIYDNMAGLPYWQHPQLKIVKYESLIENPENTLKEICTFLAISYSEDMLEFYKTQHLWYSKEIIKPNTIKTPEDHNNLRNWQINQPLYDGRERWKKDMTLEDKEAFKNTLAQTYLKQFGYVDNDAW